METFKFSKTNLNDIEFKLKFELGIKLNREYIYLYITRDCFLHICWLFSFMFVLVYFANLTFIFKSLNISRFLLMLHPLIELLAVIPWQCRMLGTVAALGIPLGILHLFPCTMRLLGS